ncbi:aquaporin NIP6-1 [Olea europaea subsp. europaea]|uniref:Aquaporin NIP6-1 n=1 Tax=Olea europaea subsp. europaea TaxID=158383 RepID=A0A8S0P7Y4_OLEEU|nr:aquaporin NIP6-1 [Olea europaea subsp. europaea]
MSHQEKRAYDSLSTSKYEIIMGTKDVASVPTMSVTPGIPCCTPLVDGQFKSERCGDSWKSLFKSCKCFSVEALSLEEGTLPSVSCALIPHPISLARKVGAEFIGTFILIFTGTATAIVNQKTQGSETLLGLAVSTGLAVMIVILSTGHISGAHVNPSVTIAFAALKHFPWKHVPVYIGAQILASTCAAFSLKAIFHPIMGGGVTVPSGGFAQAFALEFVISFNLMFVVTAVATDTRAVGKLAGIGVGATVMLNILIAGNINLVYSSRETTGASMNPVRTLGPAIAANNYKAIWIYLTAPFLGALAGAAAYSLVKLPNRDVNGHEKLPNAEHSFRR